MALADLTVSFGFRHVESYWLFYAVVSWFLAWGSYWTVAWVRRRDATFEPWPWHRLVGVAMVLWPFVKFAHGVYTSFDAVLDPNSVARTVPAEAWWRAVERRSIQYVALPLAGLWLAFGLHRRKSDMRFREKCTRFFEGISIWPRRSLLRDLAHGAWLFVFLYFGYLGLNLLLSPLESLNNGDESAVFKALTPGLAVALALTAGITEELLFRGILQTRLQRIMPVWGAIAIQSVFFGLIHSGYGTIGHIVFPALFGVAMGLIMLRFGLTPAIIIHTMVDLVIFLAIASQNGHGTLQVIPWIFAAAVAFPAAYFTVAYARERIRPLSPAERPVDPTELGPDADPLAASRRNS